MELWPFIPQRDFTESLEWSTDVIRCRGAEQRIALRSAPRHGYMFSMHMDSNRFSRAKSFARAHSASQVLLPLWGELTYVGAVSLSAVTIPFDTRYAHYAIGSQFVVWQEDDFYEVRTVTAMTDGGLTFDEPLERGYTGAILMPVREVTFSQPFEVARAASDRVTSSVRFVATQADDLAASTGMTSYRSHDVMLDRTVLVNDVQEKFEREAEEADNGIGPITLMAERTYPVQTSVLGWATLTRQELWALRTWLHTRRGKWRGFWVPSWSADLVLAQAVGPTDTTMRVQRMGYAAQEGVRDVMIVTTTGARHFRRILGGEYWSSTQELLTLDGAIGLTLAPSDIEMICLLTFMRLDADRVEIRHRAARGATVSVPIFEAPVP